MFTRFHFFKLQVKSLVTVFDFVKHNLFLFRMNYGYISVCNKPLKPSVDPMGRVRFRECF